MRLDIATKNQIPGKELPPQNQAANQRNKELKERTIVRRKLKLVQAKCIDDNIQQLIEFCSSEMQGDDIQQLKDM